MKNSLAMLSMFLFGTALGVSATMIYVDKNYVKRTDAEKEISKARETYSRLSDELREEKKKLMELNELHKSRIMDDYKNGLTSFGYVDEVVGKENAKEDEPKTEEVEKPEDDEELSYKDIYSDEGKFEEQDKDIYLIDNETFGDIGYDVQDLTYYSNGIITDEAGDVVKDPISLLGETVMDILPTYVDGGFGETYVRNELTKTDYCIDLAHTDFFES